MSEVAAWVGDLTLLVSEVDKRLADLRTGPFAARIPAEHTAEGRNARRWLVQLRTAEMLIEQEIQLRGLPRETTKPRLDLVSALRVGGVAAAVLTSTPGAQRLADQVAGRIDIPEQTAHDYYTRNLDRYQDGQIPFAQVRSEITAELAGSERDRRFALWLETRRAELVRLAPGYQHPATPGHPDATHRH